jgi:hypothetical protein
MSKMASETWPEFMKARSSAAWRHRPRQSVPDNQCSLGKIQRNSAV